MIHNPWCTQIEFVEGCTRRCWFCGIHSLSSDRQAGNNFLDPEFLRSVFKQLAVWLPKIRVEINSHGEPTLHPKCLNLLEIMRKEMPSVHLQMQTNGEPWLPVKNMDENLAGEFVDSLFNSGLNLLAINAYRPGMYSWLLEWLPEYCKTRSWKFVDFYGPSGKGTSINWYYPPKMKQIFLLDDLGKINLMRKNKVSKYIHNSGGNGSVSLLRKHIGKEPLAEPLKQRCSKPFREFIFDWNGLVPLCCQDWQDETVMGDLKVTPIKDIWEGDRFQAARNILYNRRRDLLHPCCRCDDHSTRVGLLPDPGTDPRPFEDLAKIVEEKWA